MSNSPKIISALHANWWLNLAGLLLSFLASVVLVRAIPRELFAQYAAVLAIVAVATLVFEAGANSGLTRYLREASECGATGTFYLRMQRRRWVAAIICAVAVVLLGPDLCPLNPARRRSVRALGFHLCGRARSGNADETARALRPARAF